MINFRREPTLALSEYPVKNWSFWLKLSKIYENLNIIKRQRLLHGLPFPYSTENFRENNENTQDSEDTKEHRENAYYLRQN